MNPPNLLLAPRYFTLFPARSRSDKAAQTFLAFIDELRATHDKARLTIDLRSVRRIQASAALLFKAELRYLHRRGVRFHSIATTRARVLQVLHQTGLAELLNVQGCIVIDRDDVVHWRHAAGLHNFLDPELVAGLLQDVENPIDSPLYTGTIESVSNCIEHAYQEHCARRPMEQNEDGWWAFQQVRDGSVTVCVCDLGIGIPNALPISLQGRPGLLQRLLDPFKTLGSSDCRAICAALEYGRTSTGLRNRGKGLRDATRVIDEAGHGVFFLFSNRGLYSYGRKSAEKDAREDTRRLPASIRGTIYMWHYPLSSGDQRVSAQQGRP